MRRGSVTTAFGAAAVGARGSGVAALGVEEQATANPRIASRAKERRGAELREFWSSIVTRVLASRRSLARLGANVQSSDERRTKRRFAPYPAWSRPARCEESI